VAQVVWTNEARRWLQDIYDYIAADNEAAAYRTVLAIHQRAEILLSSRKSAIGIASARRFACCSTDTIESPT
jgi:plasmid stabilization system protein ParE